MIYICKNSWYIAGHFYIIYVANVGILSEEFCYYFNYKGNQL